MKWSFRIAAIICFALSIIDMIILFNSAKVNLCLWILIAFLWHEEYHKLIKQRNNKD